VAAPVEAERGELTKMKRGEGHTRKEEGNYMTTTTQTSITTREIQALAESLGEVLLFDLLAERFPMGILFEEGFVVSSSTPPLLEEVMITPHASSRSWLVYGEIAVTAEIDSLRLLEELVRLRLVDEEEILGALRDRLIMAMAGGEGEGELPLLSRLDGRARLPGFEAEGEG